MTDHAASHEERLSRLATGDLSREDPEFEELVSCPQCRDEALATAEMIDRLDGMERERREILAGVERTPEDPAIRQRVDHALGMAGGFAPARRVRMWVLGVAAAVILGGFLAVWYWSSRSPSVSPHLLLGDSEIAIAEVRPDPAGGLMLRASRVPRAGCTLVFVIERPPGGDLLYECESEGSTCSVAPERMADWPATVDLHVEERNVTDVLAASPRRAYARR